MALVLATARVSSDDYNVEGIRSECIQLGARQRLAVLRKHMGREALRVRYKRNSYALTNGLEWLLPQRLMDNINKLWKLKERRVCVENAISIAIEKMGAIQEYLAFTNRHRDASEPCFGILGFIFKDRDLKTKEAKFKEFLKDALDRGYVVALETALERAMEDTGEGLMLSDRHCQLKQELRIGTGVKEIHRRFVSTWMPQSGEMGLWEPKKGADNMTYLPVLDQQVTRQER